MNRHSFLAGLLSAFLVLAGGLSAPEASAQNPGNNGHRITRVGRWLRVFQTIDLPGTSDDRSSAAGLEEYGDLRLQKLVAGSAGAFSPSLRTAGLR